MKYPDAVLFGKRTSPTHRAQRNLLTGAFHFQGVAGLQMQFFPQCGAGGSECLRRLGLRDFGMPRKVQPRIVVRRWVSEERRNGIYPPAQY